MIHHPDHSHVPAMKTLWREVFGDTEAFIDAYFDYWFSPETALIYGGGEAMGFLMDIGSFDGKRCSMLYALAAHPDHRGRGIGAELAVSLRRLSDGLGFGMTVLTPAEPGLFDFYEKRAGFHRGFTARTFGYKASASDAECTEISADEYRALRESLLTVPHIDVNGQALRWFSLCGGKLLRIGKSSAAAAEEIEGRLFIRELMGSSENEAADAVCRYFGKNSATVRVPDICGSDDGMCSIPVENAFIGFRFD